MARPICLLVAMLLLAGGAAAQSALEDVEDIFGGAVCDLLGNVSIPDVQTQNFCSTAGFSTKLGRCVYLDITERGLQALSSEAKGSPCRGYLQTPSATTSLTGQALPFPLSDRRPLSRALPTALLTSEGASYYWLFKNLLNFELWAGCGATNSPTTVTPGIPTTGNASLDYQVPPGWTVFSTLWQDDGVQQWGVYWPFAAVMTQGSQLVVFVRGTETLQDWLTDFTYSTGPSGAPLNLPGNVHQGFNKVASSLWPGLKAALDSLITARSSGSAITSVYMAGHSLGAGVSTLLSFATQTYLNQISPGLRVDTALFAPPNVGDSIFASAFGNLVNARRIPFLYDLIPQVPCTPTMIGCALAKVPTFNPKNSGLWNYVSVPGTLLLQPSKMPQQANAWGLLSSINPCNIARFLRATHICSYVCYLSQTVVDPNNLCLLWNTTSPAGQVGSFCFDFPSNSNPQYPY